MATKKKTRKKRTRRAVTARRTDAQNEANARKKREEWWGKMKAAMRKVEFYDALVKTYSRKAADKLFEGVE